MLKGIFLVLTCPVWGPAWLAWIIIKPCLPIIGGVILGIGAGVLAFNCGWQMAAIYSIAVTFWFCAKCGLLGRGNG